VNVQLRPFSRWHPAIARTFLSQFLRNRDEAASKFSLLADACPSRKQTLIAIPHGRLQVLVSDPVGAVAGFELPPLRFDPMGAVAGFEPSILSSGPMGAVAGFDSSVDELSAPPVCRSR
jgi:hypothetical protein